MGIATEEQMQRIDHALSGGMAALPNRVVRREVTHIGDKSVEVEIEAEGEASHADLADAVATLHRETLKVSVRIDTSDP